MSLLIKYTYKNNLLIKKSTLIFLRGNKMHRIFPPRVGKERVSRLLMTKKNPVRTPALIWSPNGL